MTQNVLDYSQNPSGNELMDNYLAGMAENQLTNHSGVSRPSYAKAGTFWIDTSTTPWVLKQFTGSADISIGTLDQSGQLFIASRALADKNGNDITTKYATVDTSQNITGAKTFSGDMKTSRTSAGYRNFICYNTGITKGTAPSSYTGFAIVLSDTDSTAASKRLSSVELTYSTTGISGASLYAYKPESGSTSLTFIGIRYPETGAPYTYAPAPTDTTTTSGTQMATTGWVNSTGNNVMHLTGNETVGGTKTFTAVPIILRGTYTGLYNRRSDLEYNVTPASNITMGGIEFQDKNNTWIGRFATNMYSSGNHIASISVRGEDNSTSSLSIRRTVLGDAYAECPTPSSATDNSTKIATTAWVNNHLSDATIKEKIVGYTIPNWQAGVSISFTDNQYEAPSNGVVVIRCDSSNDYFGGAISGETISVGGDFSSYRDNLFIVIPVLKGNILSKSSTHGSPSLTFYPAFGG